MNTDSARTTDVSEQPKPSRLQATALNASLSVLDLQRSLAWYRDVVGFTVHQEYERGDAFGAHVFRLRDPDGFKLTISSER